MNSLAVDSFYEREYPFPRIGTSLFYHPKYLADGDTYQKRLGMI
jgi:hypothetical protein